MNISPHPLRFEPAASRQQTSRKQRGDHVAILLCTRSGARFLPAQLDSIIAQSHKNWRIYASDDGSSDLTGAILLEFQATMGRELLDIRSGPRRGFVANFLSLSCASDIRADYFAFCDQDDVWESDKLTRALACLSHGDPSVPALYCSRTRLIDEADNSIGLSPLFSKAPAFRNAIVQCIAGGNTMVFNAGARRLLVRAGSEIAVPSHDWWLYILVTAMGGTVRYDRRPTVRYRVHRANAVGANHSVRARLTRIGLLLGGTLRTWTDMHLAALQPLAPDISPESRKILNEFVKARQGNVFRRILYAYILRIYRQTLAGNIALFFALVLRKA